MGLDIGMYPRDSCPRYEDDSEGYRTDEPAHVPRTPFYTGRSGHKCWVILTRCGPEYSFTARLFSSRGPHTFVSRLDPVPIQGIHPPRLCDSFSLFHRMHTSCPSRPSLSRILIPRRILNLTPHNHRPSGFLRSSLPLA